MLTTQDMTKPNTKFKGLKLSGGQPYDRSSE
jgi:hypothetical protein